MNARITDTNSFEYTRTAYKINAYGKEYELPVRTTVFCDKQDAIDRAFTDITSISTSADVLAALRKGIDLFIGDGEAEKLFPKEKEEETDIDEVTAFYRFLKEKSLENLKFHTEKYKPVSNIRRK